LHTACDCAEQCALADARTREQPDALAFAECEQSVEHTNARGNGPIDGSSSQRVWRIAIDRNCLSTHDRGLTVHRSAESVHDSTEQRVACHHGERAARRLDGIVWTDTCERPERHGDRFAVIEANHFADEGLAASLHAYEIADAHAWHGKAHRQASHTNDTPRRLQRWGGRELLSEGVEVHGIEATRDAIQVATV
jgi:hypothetical protein